MDPLSAISLAGNILQFVDTTRKFVSSAGQILKTGVAEDVLQYESLTEDLRNWAERVTPSEPQSASHDVWTEEEKCIRDLGWQSREVADELLKRLDKLKVKSQDQVLRPLESLYRTLRTTWSQRDIDVLQSRLDRIGNGMLRQLATLDSKKTLRKIETIEGYRRSDFAFLKSQLDSLFKEVSANSGVNRSMDETAMLLQNAALQGSRYAAEQLIMRQLRFDAMESRHDRIITAHSGTLKWVFGTGVNAGPPSFNDWLISDEALYWISGKPGSGKSTLMVRV